MQLETRRLLAILQNALASQNPRGRDRAILAQRAADLRFLPERIALDAFVAEALLQLAGDADAPSHVLPAASAVVGLTTRVLEEPLGKAELTDLRPLMLPRLDAEGLREWAARHVAGRAVRPSLLEPEQ